MLLIFIEIIIWVLEFLYVPVQDAILLLDSLKWRKVIFEIWEL